MIINYRLQSNSDFIVYENIILLTIILFFSILSIAYLSLLNRFIIYIRKTDLHLL